MNWTVFLIVTLIAFLIIYFNFYLIEKTRVSYKFAKIRKKLEQVIKQDIYEIKKIRATHSELKENILSQIKEVELCLTQMRYLYASSKKINEFYETQIKKLKTLNRETDEILLSLAEANEGKNYVVNELSKKDFDKINNKINSFVTEFLLTNATFVSELKTIARKQLNERELVKQVRFNRILKSVVSVILSVIVSLFANYISRFIF